MSILISVPKYVSVADRIDQLVVGYGLARADLCNPNRFSVCLARNIELIRSATEKNTTSTSNFGTNLREILDLM